MVRGGRSAGGATDAWRIRKGSTPTWIASPEGSRASLWRWRTSASNWAGTGAGGADPERLAELEERLDLIDRLGRKHGGTIESVLAHGAWCREGNRTPRRRRNGRPHCGQSWEAAKQAPIRQRRVSAGLQEGRRRTGGRGYGRSRDCHAGAVLSIDLPPVADGLVLRAGNRPSSCWLRNPGLPAQLLRDTASEANFPGHAGPGGERGGDRGRSYSTRSMPESAATRRRRSGGNAAIGMDTSGDRVITHLPQVASRAAAHFTVEKSTGPVRSEMRRRSTRMLSSPRSRGCRSGEGDGCGPTRTRTGDGEPVTSTSLPLG